MSSGALETCWEKPQYESRGCLFKTIVTGALEAFPEVPEVQLLATASDMPEGRELEDMRLYPMVG